MMDTEKQINLNRLVAVGAGTMLWITLLKLLLPIFAFGHALLLGVWIALGSQHYARTLADFRRPLKFHTFIGLALLSPGWPFLYWNLKYGSNRGRYDHPGDD